MTPPPHDIGAATSTPAGWRVPFVRPDAPPFADVAAGIERALTSGQLTKGPELARLEEEAARLLGVAHVVGVANCTVGLALVLRTLAAVRQRRTAGCPQPAACPLGPAPSPAAAAATEGRDEVILPSFVFLAAPAAVVWAGFRPVFVDVDPDDWTVAPRAVTSALSDRTAAILACHTFGCPCDLPALRTIADRAGVPLVTDAAHGLGSALHGRQVGAGGLAQVFSLSPTKLVVAGEGGLVATDCGCLAEAVRTGREYGNDGAYGCTLPGLNARLPEISALVARASLARLPEVLARRTAAADAYREALTGLPGITFQHVPPGARSSWKDFTIAVAAEECGGDRDALRAALARHGVETRAYYSPACHRMEAFRDYVPPGTTLGITDRLAATLVSLPMGGHVTPAIARDVAAEVRRWVARPHEGPRS